MCLSQVNILSIKRCAYAANHLICGYFLVTKISSQANDAVDLNVFCIDHITRHFMSSMNIIYDSIDRNLLNN